MSSQFASLIRGFAKQLGMDSLPMESDMSCTLFLDDLCVTIRLLENQERIALYAALGSIPATGREELYASLLEGNLFYLGTGGATIALDRTSGIIVLHTLMPLRDMDDAAFYAAVEDFTRTADMWREVCAKSATVTPGVTEDTRPATGDWMQA